MARLGNKLKMELDPTCPFAEQYTVRGEEVEKTGKMYSQVYCLHPVPESQKHYFGFKIIRMSFKSISLGVITPANFKEAYSRDKPNAICFDAYSHSIYNEGQKIELDVNVKLGDVIKAVVEVPKRMISWHLNQDQVGSTEISENMAQQQLYPYMEMSNKWIKIRLNHTDYDPSMNIGVTH